MKQRSLLMTSLIILCAVFVVKMPSYAMEYYYDDNGRVSKVVHDDGSVTTYKYDKNGNIISVDTTYSKTDESIGSDTSQSSTSGEKMDEYINIDTSVPENENLGSNNSNKDLQTNKNNNLDKSNKDNNADNSSNDVTNNNDPAKDKNSIFTGDNAYIIPVAFLLVISLAGIIIVLKKRNEEH